MRCNAVSDEKIVTAQYEAGAVLPQDEDFIENRLEDGVMKVTLFLNGELSSMSQPVLPVENSPYEEAEFIMCDMMYQLLSRATGVQPAWGMITGVRPVKLFHNVWMQESPEGRQQGSLLSTFM